MRELFLVSETTLRIEAYEEKLLCNESAAFVSTLVTREK